MKLLVENYIFLKTYYLLNLLTDKKIFIYFYYY